MGKNLRVIYGFSLVWQVRDDEDDCDDSAGDGANDTPNDRGQDLRLSVEESGRLAPSFVALLLPLGLLLGLDPLQRPQPNDDARLRVVHLLDDVVELEFHVRQDRQREARRRQLLELVVLLDVDRVLGALDRVEAPEKSMASSLMLTASGSGIGALRIEESAADLNRRQRR